MATFSFSSLIAPVGMEMAKEKERLGRKEGRENEKVWFQVKSGKDMRSNWKNVSPCYVLGRTKWPSLLKQGFSATRTIRSVRITNARLER